MAEIQRFLTKDLDTYLEEMEVDGTYADHVCINAISKMLPCTMLLVQADHPDTTIGSSSPPTLVLGYLPEMKHYVSLEPMMRFVQD